MTDEKVLLLYNKIDQLIQKYIELEKMPFATKTDRNNWERYIWSSYYQEFE